MAGRQGHSPLSIRPRSNTPLALYNTRIPDVVQRDLTEKSSLEYRP
jgi:hypothetical protein